MVVWGAGVQSNNCRQTAASCAKLGLECRLYLSRATHNDDVQGNLLLDHLVGAKVEIVDVPLGPDLDDLMLARAEEFRAAGRRPYCWDRGHVKPIAAVSYALCLAEIVDELHALGLQPDAVYVSSAGSTGSGLALGKAALGLKCAVRSICPICWPWDVRSDIAEITNHAAALLGLPHRERASDIEADEGYVGPGYGVLTPGCREAMNLLAHREGILLDPSYTAKAMAGLIDHVRTGRLKPGAIVVFIHTGGLPAVFAYRDELMAAPER
jgi:1-aminocyclopropane-1-carboxylate deaminase/D-cysteine desulfhydrase-like pyridoxal-dependent ACC family enzyme